MAVSHAEAKSMLAVDIGSTTTRALLFDAVEGRYRFLAEGVASTTVGAPLRDASEGVRLALDQLQAVTGRVLIDADEGLIMPGRPDGSGVDGFVATFSAGPPLKVFAVGLLEDVSLDSARRLAASTYAQLIGSLTLTDRRKMEERIDLIIRLRPDLVLISGGTENGAAKSVLNLIEPVGLACHLMPQGQKPEILYAGNQKLAEEIQASLGRLAPLHLAPNLRPSLEEEQLEAGLAKLIEVLRGIRSRQIQGLQELVTWAGERAIPTANGFGSVIRFLSRVYDPAKGVLGVDVGASTTTIAAAFAGVLHLRVIPRLGIGEGVVQVLQYSQLDEIARWLPFEIAPEELRDYIYNRNLYPGSLPATLEDLALDQALAREILRGALRAARRSFPAGAFRSRRDLMPWFEPIIATGGVLTRAPSHGQSLMMLLDAIQPTGVTTFVLDQNNLSPSLGAAAAVNPELTVQVLESGTFLNLGTVISPVANARPGSPVLRARLVYEEGSEVKVDVKQGTLETLALSSGQVARLYLQPLQRADVGLGGPGRGGSLRVVGGALGVVIDARGRPLRLPEDAEVRRELLRKWSWTLGG